MMADVVDRAGGGWGQQTSTSPLTESTSASSSSSRSSSQGRPLMQQRGFPFLQSPALNARLLQLQAAHRHRGSSGDVDAALADAQRESSNSAQRQQQHSVLDHPLLQGGRRGRRAQDSGRADTADDSQPSRPVSPAARSEQSASSAGDVPSSGFASSASSPCAPLSVPTSPSASSSASSSAAVEAADEAALSPQLPSFQSVAAASPACLSFLNTLLLSDRSCLTLCLLNGALYVTCFLLLLLHARLTASGDNGARGSGGLWHALHLWLCLSAMLVLFLVFSAPGKKQRISGIVLCLLLVCVATYASFASGALPVLEDVFGHALHPLRYVEWICTTPLMLLLVCNLQVLPTPLLLWIVAADVLMIAFGLLASLSASYAAAALWLTLSFACQLDTLWEMHRVFSRYRPRVRRYRRLMRTVSFLEGWLDLTYAWFPGVWLLAASGAIDDGGAMWLYFVGDTLGKMLYSAALLIINLELLEHEEALQRVQYEADMRVFLINERMRSKDDTARQAMDSNERKREFLRYLLHELRVPLNAVVLGLEAHKLSIDSHQSSSQQLSYPTLPSLPSPSVAASAAAELEGVDDMLQAAGDMTRLLDDVLSLQRVEDGELLLERRPMRLQDTAQACVRVMSSWAHSKGLRLVCDIDVSLQPVLSDEHRIRQLLINFLSNAIRFSSPSPSLSAQQPDILLSLQRCPPFDDYEPVLRDHWDEPAAAEATAAPLAPPSPDVLYVRASIRDRGIGISSSELRRMFEPFVQLRSGEAEKGRGTGLGLAICRKLVELLGGRIGVTSAAGAGSDFFFELPMLIAEVNDSAAVTQDSVAAADETGMEEPPSPGAEAASHLRRRRVGRELSDSGAVQSLPLRPSEAPPPVSAPAAARPDQQLSSSPHLPAAAHPAASASPSPIPAPAPPHVARSAVHAAVSASHPLRVLVVDDAASNRKLLARVVSAQRPAVCEQACDGAEAVELVREDVRRFDVVLCDKEMPVIDGYGAVRQMRLLGVRCPIIGVTANALQRDQQDFIDCGLDDIVTKPVNVARLMAAIQSALDRRQTLHG